MESSAGVAILKGDSQEDAIISHYDVKDEGGS